MYIYRNGLLKNKGKMFLLRTPRYKYVEMCVYVCMYVCSTICVCIYIYVYTFIYGVCILLYKSF